MEEKDFKRILGKVLDGTASSDEKQLVTEFADHFIETNKSEVFKSDLEKNRIKKEIYAKVQSLQKSNRAWLRVAASIVIMLGIGITYWYQKDNLTNNIQAKTSFGERMELELSDGSEVVLNANSSLDYSREFDGSTRKVYLEGEAHFKISKDSLRPFIVRSGEIETKVLGTQFNLNAFEEDSVVIISLFEGSVQVSSASRQYDLLPNQAAVFDIKNNTSHILSVDSMAALGWKSNKLVFNRTSLEEVTRKLYRQFGLKSKFENEDLKNRTITGIFESESLETILKAITKATKTQIHYENQKTILIQEL